MSRLLFSGFFSYTINEYFGIRVAAIPAFSLQPFYSGGNLDQWVKPSQFGRLSLEWTTHLDNFEENLSGD